MRVLLQASSKYVLERSGRKKVKQEKESDREELERHAEAVSLMKRIIGNI